MEEGERERCDLARRWFWGGTGEEDEEESEGPGLSAELSEERDIKTEAADGEVALSVSPPPSARSVRPPLTPVLERGLAALSVL